MEREGKTITYWTIVWGQFKKNRLAYVGLWLVLLLVLLAIYAPVLCLDYPFWISYQGDDGARVVEYPWFQRLLFDRNVFENTVDIFFNLLLLLSPMVLVTGVGLRLLRRRGGWRKGFIFGWSAVVLVVLGYLVMFQTSQPYRDYVEIYESGTTGVDEELAAKRTAGTLTAEEEATLLAGRAEAIFPVVPMSFRKPYLSSVMSKASALHPMGTDNRGRDVFARMLYGTRISLTIGILAVSLYISIGIFIGALAGYFRGWVDTLVLRLIEVMMCFPSFILILTLAAFVEQPSIFYVMLIIGFTRWTGPARLIRGEFLRLGGQDFVTAAVASGIPQHRVIFRYVLPNALGPVLVNATFGIAAAILVEASLAFLGLSDPSAPSWGEILNIGRQTQSMSLILIPGAALFVTLSLFNLVGEGIRDALDPKLRT